MCNTHRCKYLQLAFILLGVIRVSNVKIAIAISIKKKYYFSISKRDLNNGKH